ncbi:hypothetical protein GCM10007989_15230 [Devosia pacifica]|uniref:SH3-like domain-containing protein n=1 Tax=Devosia pacifica TaxID=1335967 RepID=A0A918S3H6_9HYPH|nr:SH3 domain-containing protein [Devosia pacifica]GHA21008.1 hypothetical protein GCM10007989_15230 [Devosia pacifica]
MIAIVRQKRRTFHLTIACLLTCLMAVTMLVFTVPVSIAQDNPSGLALPRFASTRSSPVNVRVGPGTQYDVAWIYVKAGIPVEIIQEFDTWRRIRDVDGEDGWVHQNLLVGDRRGYVAPWAVDTQVPLRSGPDASATTRAVLTSGMRVQVSECDGTWCAVRASNSGASSGPTTYSGYVEQDELWGVYQSEVIE